MFTKEHSGSETHVVSARSKLVMKGLFLIPTASSSCDCRRKAAAELVPADRPGDFNQGLMELGATVCTPKTPSCSSCPLKDVCFAFAAAKEAGSGGGSAQPKEEAVGSRKRRKVEPSEVAQDTASPLLTAQKAVDVKAELLVGEEERCTLCEPQSPLWYSSFVCSSLPLTPAKKESPVERVLAAVVLGKWNGGYHLLMQRRPDSGVLAGQWELPQVLWGGTNFETHCAASASTASKQATKQRKLKAFACSLPPPAFVQAVGALKPQPSTTKSEHPEVPPLSTAQCRKLLPICFEAQEFPSDLVRAARKATSVGTVTHIFSHVTQRFDVALVSFEGSAGDDLPLPPGTAYCWHALDSELAKLGLSTRENKLLGTALPKVKPSAAAAALQGGMAAYLAKAGSKKGGGKGKKLPSATVAGGKQALLTQILAPKATSRTSSKAKKSK